MLEAEIFRNTGRQTIVRCPYCRKTHKHGNAGQPHIIGETRSSHCLNMIGGEYKIVRYSPRLFPEQ